ncbi:ATP-binding cassette domain-containing protein [Sphingobium sp. ZW T5_29]|uniref:ATP-binding cassette domain-containing protein n=1 Tax=Sphingobium sp. ZW T5_29 TaxID=3378077 RepID=UPI003851954B
MSFDVDVSKTLGDRIIEARFVVPGGLTVLRGVSGAGKTSVLNMVAGLLTPDRGHVAVNGDTLFDAAKGANLPTHRRRLGYVFQDGRLFPHLRVRANLLYGYRLAASEECWMTLDEVVAFLGIAPLLDRWPRSLSGGEAQRVALGRALLSGARALLLDEPLASIDPARRSEIIDAILRIRDELKLPMLYVTHDPAEAERLGNQLATIGS